MSNQGCKVKLTYKPVCNKPGEVCKPVTGSFTTECEVKNCKKLC